MQNILITFVSDNEKIIRNLEKYLENLTEDNELDRKSLEEEISFRDDLVREAKFLLKETCL